MLHVFIRLSKRFFATGNGYGPIDREVGRYDIIVTNTESILYYCTSIFVIINPNRVTRGTKEETSNEARQKRTQNREK